MSTVGTAVSKAAIFVSVGVDGVKEWTEAMQTRTVSIPRLFVVHGSHSTAHSRSAEQAALAACKALGNPLPSLQLGAVVLYVR